MSKKEGRVVHEIPPPKRPSKYNINWDKFIEMARMTGQPVLAGVNIRNSTVKSLRQTTRPPFVTTEGRVVVTLRNSEVKNDGQRYGDVYFTWQPYEKPEESSAAGAE